MRRSASTAQLELPLVADVGPAPPEPRPASECGGCGWLREGPGACPVCRAPRAASPRKKLPPRRVV